MQKQQIERLKRNVQDLIAKTTLLKKEIDVRKTELEITYALLKGLSRSKGLTEILKIIFKELNKLIAFDDAHLIVRLNPHQYQLISHAAPKTLNRKMLSEDNAIQTFFYQPRTLILTQSPFDCLENNRHLSHLIFPLRGTALLHFSSKQSSAFKKEDIEKLKEIENPIAIAIERMKLLEIVEQGSREWESTFDAISDLVTVIDENFTLIKANRATEKITRQKVEQVIGKKCFEALARRKTPCRNCPAVESFKNQALTSEKEIIDFKDRNYLSWSYPISGERQKGGSMVVYYRDQTQPSQLFRQVIQSEKMAAIGHLANSLAHELNNPLTGITAFAQILKKELGENHKFYPDILEIEKASLRCKHIIENLLHFSENVPKKIQNALSLNSLLESTLPFIQYSSTAKQNIRIEKNFDKNLPNIRGNPNELQQVFLNLLLNAIQAMPHGGTITLKTACLPKKSVVQVTISDTGAGIPKQNIGKIFDPFFTTKEKTSGTGLGLSVSYGIIRDHKGTIEVESRLKKGSTFKVLLPVD